MLDIVTLIRENLREARHFLGLSSDDICKTLGWTYGRIRHFEDGYIIPTAREIRSLADIYKRPYEYFFEDHGEWSGVVDDALSATLNLCKGISASDKEAFIKLAQFLKASGLPPVKK